MSKYPIEVIKSNQLSFFKMFWIKYTYMKLMTSIYVYRSHDYCFLHALDLLVFFSDFVILTELRVDEGKRE